ncbi:AAA family ATPase [Deinococcus aestuarii]|uniref:AAA family ATPase n=1 Tax=Deinococcus aestuarii TaxID=2774531 RepID=UPI001C0AA054|nr:AAA family ATPase [Deinococcus aestuarii]
MTHTAPDPLLARVDERLDALRRAKVAIHEVVVGQGEVVDQVLVALLAGGHVLVEGAPGMGKTLLVRTVADVFGLRMGRVQFTPDLMPADITGTLVLSPDERGVNRLEFMPGPIFAQLLLADEVNRATPKTQSALLEAMQEGTVTVAGEGRPLPRPFFVLATQNPIEQEGTYLLPEAQLDRFFFKVDVPFPDADVLGRILAQTTGLDAAQARACLTPVELLDAQRTVRALPVSPDVVEAVSRLIVSTQPSRPESGAEVRRYVRFGVSPRGAQTLVLAAKAQALLSGRAHVSLTDVRAVLLPSLRHRFQLNFEGVASGVDKDALLLRLLDAQAG